MKYLLGWALCIFENNHFVMYNVNLHIPHIKKTKTVQKDVKSKVKVPFHIAGNLLPAINSNQY